MVSVHAVLTTLNLQPIKPNWIHVNIYWRGRVLHYNSGEAASAPEWVLYLTAFQVMVKKAASALLPKLYVATSSAG
jgi:hypothetical protein